MWLLYTVVSMFLVALVSYTDEKLAIDNKVPKSFSIHQKIGGVVIMSTTISLVGAAVLYSLFDITLIQNSDLVLSVISGFFVVFITISYFYLFQFYSGHQIVALFPLSSVWLLLIEIMFGATLTIITLIGIVILILAAYLLDNGSFSWKAASSLLLLVLPVTLLWALTLFLVSKASENSSEYSVLFYQLICVGLIGLLLFLYAKPYRQGFLYRIEKQAKAFLGVSFINESLAMTAFLFTVLAISAAPLATYYTALSGMQSLFLFALLWLFPVHERNSFSRVQLFSIFLTILGVFLIEFYQ